jgi:putative SOS response-associated peptidase YedK
MCSRYTLTSPHEAVRNHFRYLNEAVFPPRYNIAPSQPVAIVRDTERCVREMVLVRWGLIPAWVKDPRAFKMIINARSEGASDKPSFRAGLRHKRCLIPADGFYEWTGGAGAKRPHLVRPRGGGPMGLGAIYENWLGADGSEIETMAILTTAANPTVGRLHDRMPVIIGPDDFEVWLDCRPGTATHIQELLRPAPDDMLEIIEVSRRLNNPANEGPGVQEPVERQGTLL